jgi:GNAT superfamily N-acetyltransferase
MAAKNTGWVELGEGDVAELQRFIVANPEYWRVVMEREPAATAAREIFDDRPPAEWPWQRKWLVALRDADGGMAAMAQIIEGLFAVGIWHVGLFITAGRLHGTGESGKAYASLERWMRASGAQWVRLGVVVGNARAERFWEKAGFVEVKRRHDIEVEGLLRDLRVMVKPLAARPLQEYLALVERDRPE